jgi:hypothetical protein
MAQPALASARPQSVIRWRVHLARKHPLRAAAAIFLIIASAAAAHLIWPHPVAALAAGLLVFSAVAEFLLPIHYRIGADGVWCRNFVSVKRLKWADVKRCYRDAHGVKMSPLSGPSRLEAYRGIYLWLDDDGDGVIAALRQYLQERTPS